MLRLRPLAKDGAVPVAGLGEEQSVRQLAATRRGGGAAGGLGEKHRIAHPTGGLGLSARAHGAAGGTVEAADVLQKRFDNVEQRDGLG